MLHNANDWFALKKMQFRVMEKPLKQHFKTKLKNEWKRMLAMDVSDVYYDKILMNGNPSTDLKRIDGSN
jgi:hypothetical protein